MPLKELSPDPTPTEEELAPHLSKLLALSPDLMIIRPMASGHWRSELKQENPDLFHVPFASNIDHFPGRIKTYPGYQRSRLWKEIRERVIEAAQGACAGCVRPAEEVHHRDYRPRVLRGEDDGPLVPLCGQCHHEVHNDGAKKRDNWQESERVLASLVDRKDARLKAAL